MSCVTIVLQKTQKYVIYNNIAKRDLNMSYVTNLGIFLKKYVILNIKGVVVMNNKEMSSIFEQINNLKKPATESQEKIGGTSEDALREVLNSVSEEIQRVLDENSFTQEDLCRITNMSQSNISKIQNGKDIPRIETLQKIAAATHTRLVISFESMEGDE